jgi:hypothetical protein
MLVNRFGRELTNFFDQSGNRQDSTSNTWKELDGKVRMRILGLDDLNVRDWAR